jgi:hypothetical protein
MTMRRRAAAASTFWHWTPTDRRKFVIAKFRTLIMEGDIAVES